LQRIALSPLLQVLTTKLLERSPQDEIRRAFALFDLQQTGRITVKELSLIARQLQVDIEPQELQDMIAEFDRDQDGAINEEEFKAIVTALDD
jgi:centrin-3